MIIFGIKKRHIHCEKVGNKKCTYCGNIGLHTFDFYSRYIHFFWIPTIAFSKQATSQCNSCNSVIYTKNKRSQELQLALENSKRNAKIPIRHFSGLFLFLGLIFISFLINKNHKKNRINYINSPKINDVITYKINNEYSTLKVTKISKDSIHFITNSLKTKKVYKVYKINEDYNYTSKKIGISLKEFKDNFKSKKYIDINR